MTQPARSIDSVDREQAAVTGEWERLPYEGGSQIEAVHMALLRTGKVLYFSGFRFPEEVPCETRIWYPKTGEIKPAQTLVNLICAGHSFLADGRLYCTGGTLEYRNAPARPWVVRLLRPITPLIIKLAAMPLFRPLVRQPELTGPTFTYLFNPQSEQWEFAGDMEEGRWYPTNTILPDGRILILSGANDGGGVGKKDPIRVNRRVETFSLEAGCKQVAALPTPAPAHVRSETSPAQDADSNDDGGHEFLSLYPRMHVLPLSEDDRKEYPAGKLFCSGYGPETRFLNIATWEWKEVASLNFGERHDGCSVLLPLRPPDYRARVLTLGGVDGRKNDPHATDTVEMMDFGVQPFAWRPVAPMRYKRVNASAVLLPDGKVLVSGGNSTSQFDDPVHDAEVFDPDTEKWSLAARMEVPRGYHSTALLLPDGRVLMSGSTPYGHYELRMEVYWPYYLFSKQPRPTISRVPDKSIFYGQPFEVTCEQTGTIRSAVLIRPGAVTHAFDMDQRYVELRFNRKDTDLLIVEAPPDRHVAPPGYYMLFILGEHGVPSEAKFVHLAAQA